MAFANIILLLIIILNISLGLLVLLSNYKKATNILFTCFIASALLWIICLYFSNFYGPYALLWTKLTFLGAILIGLFLAYFSFHFPDTQSRITWKAHLVLILPTVAIIALVLLSNRIIAGVTLITNGTGVAQGSWYYAWPIYFLSILIFSFINLFSKFKTQEGRRKNQLLVVFTGLALSLLFGVTTNLVFPFVFKNDSLSNIGPYSTIIFIAFTAYAIVRHGFLDIKVIATETLVVVINIVLLFNLLNSENSTKVITNGAVLVFSLLASYLLVKSVVKEVKQKEHLQELTSQLTQAVTHLQKLDEMKNEFVSLASHELLTPVSAIEGYLSMMIDERMAKINDPTARRYLDRIYRSSRRLARLIADMLNISRIEEGRLLVEKKDVDLSELIKQVIDELKFKAEESKQKIVFAGGHWKTYCDADKIKEVIINLIGNSLKYSQNPGSVNVQVKRIQTIMIKDTTSKRSEKQIEMVDDQAAMESAIDPHYRNLIGKEQLLISVKDQGIGIPKEDLPGLFKKFHRLGGLAAKSQGTGLGLYISRALVELHHGRIWADSEGSGQGSTFYFTLPLINVKPQIIEMEKGANQNKEQLKPLAKPMKSEIDDI